MPFAVRTLQPVLEHLDRSMEEAAATLGAGRWRTFLFVIGPMLAPTVITGFALSFARAVGEYGSIVFISGNKAYETEIAPHVIEMEDRTVTLTGTVEAQYQQWRELLQQIYQQERMTPAASSVTSAGQPQ